MEALAREKPLLVLCVDRDNDIGQKLSVRTPIIGEEKVLDVAVRYAIAEPEDSDSNALFAAIQVYRELKEKYGFKNVDVAVIAGDPSEGFKADIEILRELDEILARKPFKGIVLVSDGPTDEQVIPLIQSRLPVVSVRRVIVQQSRGVEESFVIILRYMKKLVEEPHYRKYSLGLPGSLIVLYTVLSVFLPAFAWPLLVSFTGLVLLVKGFSIDTRLRELYESSPVTFASVLVSAMLMLLACIGGFERVSELPSVHGLEAVGYFFLGVIGGEVFVSDLVILSVSLPFVGKIMDGLIYNKPLRGVEFSALVFVLFFRQILVELSRILVGTGDVYTLLYWIFVDLISVTIVTAIYMIRRTRARK